MISKKEENLAIIEKNSDLYLYLKKLLAGNIDVFLNASEEPQTIRVNTLKNNYPDLLKKIKNTKNFTALPFSEIGFTVNDITTLSQSIDFFKGDFAFQGAASQIPPIVLDPKPGERVLDIAAAPGSKSTQIAAMMQNEGLLVVNDASLSRIQALNGNTQKAGMINHCIYYRPGERLGRLFPEYFDKVLVDTPCTGLGTLAANREICSWWNDSKLQKLNYMQHQLLVSAIKSARIGAEIIYSTCSVAPEENEIVLDNILQKYPLSVESIDIAGLENLDEGMTFYKGHKLHPSLHKTRRVWPHKHGMEGFFIARLKKTAKYADRIPLKAESFKTVDSKNEAVKTALEKISDDWGIENGFWDGYNYIKTSDRIWLFNNQVNTIVKEGFTNGGILLADEKLQLWKLSHQAVRFLGAGITKRRINLDENDLQQLFAAKECPNTDALNGYYALDLNGNPAAVVYSDKDKIRIKLGQVFNYDYHV